MRIQAAWRTLFSLPTPRDAGSKWTAFVMTWKALLSGKLSQLPSISLNPLAVGDLAPNTQVIRVNEDGSSEPSTLFATTHAGRPMVLNFGSCS